MRGESNGWKKWKGGKEEEKEEERGEEKEEEKEMLSSISCLLACWSFLSMCCRSGDRWR